MGASNIRSPIFESPIFEERPTPKVSTARSQRMPNDPLNRSAVKTWDPFKEDLKLIEDEILGKLGPPCTCPSWWFPLDIREVARRLPHLHQDALHHHAECDKTRQYQKPHTSSTAVLLHRGLTHGKTTLLYQRSLVFR